VDWRTLGDKPSDTAAIADRDGVLQAAFAVEHRSRAEFLVDCCRGQRVLDLGCANHDFTLQPANKKILHARLAEAASEIVGVDFELSAVKTMRERGYDVIEADITGDVSEVLAQGGFDVVVAGELIEHLATPADLFDLASRVLRPGGKLVLTTPNPYSPIRTRRGALRETWESVDHVAYYPPTGVAELAERAGMRLVLATTVGGPEQQGMLKRMIKNRLKHRPDDLSIIELLTYKLRRRGGQLGETAIYVAVLSTLLS